MFVTIKKCQKHKKLKKQKQKQKLKSSKICNKRDKTIVKK